MTNPSSDSPYELLLALIEAYSHVQSVSAIRQTTLNVSADVVGADMCFIAQRENSGLTPVLTRPSDWTDTDDLLSPVSLPSVIASQGISYLISDRGDVRGAPRTASVPTNSTVEYPSLLIVPVEDEMVLIAGKRNVGAFSEDDLETLRIIGLLATSLIEHSANSRDDSSEQDTMSKAAAGLSHDAQNFLGIIYGRLELAREDSQLEHLDAIERATQRLEELIEDTRMLLETGDLVTDVEEVSLDDVVQEAWEAEDTAHATLVATTLEKVVADRSRLHQLLANLFRNAVELAAADVTVTVGMLPEDTGFYVEDNGPGIDPSEQYDVMKFAYSTAEGHTGLGLNIVQWIARDHGWNITITDGQKSGTRFEFVGVETVS